MHDGAHHSPSEVALARLSASRGSVSEAEETAADDGGDEDRIEFATFLSSRHLRCAFTALGGGGRSDESSEGGSGGGGGGFASDASGAHAPPVFDALYANRPLLEVGRWVPSASWCKEKRCCSVGGSVAGSIDRRARVASSSREGHLPAISTSDTSTTSVQQRHDRHTACAPCLYRPLRCARGRRSRGGLVTTGDLQLLRRTRTRRNLVRAVRARLRRAEPTARRRRQDHGRGASALRRGDGS
jgi:hypothetical protein